MVICTVCKYGHGCHLLVHGSMYVAHCRRVLARGILFLSANGSCTLALKKKKLEHVHLKAGHLHHTHSCTQHYSGSAHRVLGHHIAIIRNRFPLNNTKTCFRPLQMQEGVPKHVSLLLALCVSCMLIHENQDRKGFQGHGVQSPDTCPVKGF